MTPRYFGESPLAWEPGDAGSVPDNPDGRRILVVEDDAPIREVTVTTLRLAGYRVASAADGAQAVEVARTFRPELVLMDLMLPGIDGWEAIRHIVAAPGLGAPPVIALSARVGEADRQRAFDAGAIHFVAKPCRASELLQAVGDGLREPDPDEP